MMPFVERNAENKVVGTFSCKQLGRAEEHLANDDAEVLAFQNPAPTQAELIAEALTDSEQPHVLARKVEDLVALVTGTKTIEQLPELGTWAADRATKRNNA
jgi:hypothetical protein